MVKSTRIWHVNHSSPSDLLLCRICLVLLETLVSIWVLQVCSLSIVHVCHFIISLPSYAFSFYFLIFMVLGKSFMLYLGTCCTWGKGGPGASGRVLSPVTGRSWVRVAVSSHCIDEGKASHWHPSPDPAQSGGSLHWVRLEWSLKHLQVFHQEKW